MVQGFGKGIVLWDSALLLVGWRYRRRGGWALGLVTCRSCRRRATDHHPQGGHYGFLFWFPWCVCRWLELMFIHPDTMPLVTCSLPASAILLSNGSHLLPDSSPMTSLYLRSFLRTFWKHLYLSRRIQKLHLCSWLLVHCLSKSCGRSSSL